MTSRSSNEFIVISDKPSITSTSFLQQLFLTMLASKASETSPQQVSTSEKIETSTKVSPQKCFSIVNDNDDINIKKDSAREKTLCVMENFTMQSYKILKKGFMNYQTINDSVYNNKTLAVAKLILSAELKIV